MRHFRILVAILTLATAGCAMRGLLYTRVVRPYTRDFEDTPVGSKTCRVREHVLSEPITRAHVSVLFTTRIVQESAHAAGMTKIDYADLETLSILRGIYERQTLILCGD